MPFRFDVQKMQKEITALENPNWLQHYQTLQYQGQWTALPLRSINGDDAHIFVLPNEASAYQNTSFLEACPYLKDVIEQFKFPLKTVRLLKLHAGAIIKEHTDNELNFENGEIRLHIPIITNNKISFYLQNELLQMKEGECWYTNVNLKYKVTNESNVDRIHLVIDGEVNDWVKNLFINNHSILKKTIEVEIMDYDNATKKQMIARFREMNTETSIKMANDLEKTIL